MLNRKTTMGKVDKKKPTWLNDTRKAGITWSCEQKAFNCLVERRQFRSLSSPIWNDELECGMRANGVQSNKEQVRKHTSLHSFIVLYRSFFFAHLFRFFLFFSFEPNLIWVFTMEQRDRKSLVCISSFFFLFTESTSKCSRVFVNNGIHRGVQVDLIIILILKLGFLGSSILLFEKKLCPWILTKCYARFVNQNSYFKFVIRRFQLFSFRIFAKVHSFLCVCLNVTNFTCSFFTCSDCFRYLFVASNNLKRVSKRDMEINKSK